MSDRSKSLTVLTLNTLAFTACFAVWMLNGVLVTYLVDQKIFAFDQVQIGVLMGVPVLTGSLIRLPVGMLTDRFGGRVVFPVVMLAAAAGCLGLSTATSYGGFVAGSLGFGLAGTGFAVGIAYTSIWFKKEQQGTALGIFGVGNAGSALTSMGAPILLGWLTADGVSPEGWRNLPRIYAAGMVAMAVIFSLFTWSKRPEHAAKTLREELAPLAVLRVWRFGLYYFLVFGGFVALAQWLIPYYVNAYSTSVATAGLLAAVFSLPSGLIRALGGWMSDRFGARSTMYWILSICALACFLLMVPRMEISSPGEGVMAAQAGTVTAVTPESVVVGERRYPLRAKVQRPPDDESALVLPRSDFWQEAAVKAGDAVKKKQLLARGVTHIFFQANVWIFTFLAFVVGIAMGIGKAAVYKYIPEYFPDRVGVVGGIVGVIGGLGGFVGPVLFGYLLRATGLWTSCWMLLFGLSIASLLWLHLVVRRMTLERTPAIAHHFEDGLAAGSS